MKSLLTIILFLGFVSIAVFGVFGMHAGMQNHNGGCIAATSQRTNCPKQSDPLEYLTFHLNAFRGFSMATFGENILVSLFAITLLVVGAGLALFLGNPASPQLDFAYFRYRQRENLISPPEQRLLRWLALHENSPANSIGRRYKAVCRTVFVSYVR